MSFGPIDYGRLKGAFAETLREELAWRRGIRWFLGWNAGAKDVPPLFRGKWQFAEEMPDGDILLTAQEGFIMKVSRDYEVKWRRLEGVMGNHMFNTAVVNYVDGRILVSDPANHRVFVYNPETDKVELVLDRFVEGPFGTPRANWEFHQYHRYSETGRIIVVDFEKHFVALFDEKGNQLYSWGEYGVAGNGRRLNHPLWATGTSTYLHIVDEGNNRGIYVNLEAGDYVSLDGEVWPRPSHTEHSPGDYRSIASSVFPPVVSSMDGPLGMGWWVSELCFTPTRELTWLGTHHGNVYEIDFRAAPRYRVPVIWPNLTDVSLGARESTGVYPLPCWGWKRVVIQAMSTQDATLNIYVLKTRGGFDEIFYSGRFDADGNPQWQLYDSVALTANKLEVYPIGAPAGVMGVEVVMGSTAGTIDLRCLFDPEV